MSSANEGLGRHAQIELLERGLLKDVEERRLQDFRGEGLHVWLDEHSLLKELLFGRPCALFELFFIQIFELAHPRICILSDEAKPSTLEPTHLLRGGWL